MLLDIYSRTKFVQTFAEKSGLQLVYEKNLAVPYTDGTRMVVAKPEVDWDLDNYTQWLAAIYHELGHNKPKMRDVFTLVKDKKINMSSLLGGLLNIVDDYRQEKHELGMYAGRDTTLSKGNALICEKHVEHFTANPPKAGAEATDFDIAMAVQCWSLHDRAAWQPHLINVGDALIKLHTPKAQEIYGKLLSSFKGRLDALVTAEDEYQLVLELLADATDREPAEEEAKGTQNSGSEKGEDGQGVKSGEGEGEQGDEEGEGGAGSGVVDWEDFLLHSHDEAHERGDGTAQFSYDTATFAGSYVFDPTVIEQTASDESPRYYIQDWSGTSSMAEELRQLLLVKTQSRKINGQKTGKLSNKSVYRAALKNTGAYQRSVFSKKVSEYSLDCAIYVLLDASGSMSRGRDKHAIAAAMHLSEALSSISVPSEIAAYTTENFDPDAKTTITTVKRFDERIDSHLLCNRLNNAYMCTCHNLDGEALLSAYSKILNRTEARKLIVIVSDGMPEGHRTRGDQAALLKKVTAQIQGEHSVELYGIGIETNSVRYFYNNYAVLNNGSELEPKLISLIKNYIIK